MESNHPTRATASGHHYLYFKLPLILECTLQYTKDVRGRAALRIRFLEQRRTREYFQLHAHVIKVLSLIKADSEVRGDERQQKTIINSSDFITTVNDHPKKISTFTFL
jgi:hypothetical protein